MAHPPVVSATVGVVENQPIDGGSASLELDRSPCGSGGACKPTPRSNPAKGVIVRGGAPLVYHVSVKVGEVKYNSLGSGGI
jgi:hypothetical protein